MAKKTVPKKDLVEFIHWLEDQYWPGQAIGSVKEARNKLVDDFDLPFKPL